MPKNALNGETVSMSLKVGSFEKAGLSEWMQQGLVSCLGEKDEKLESLLKPWMQKLQSELSTESLWAPKDRSSSFVP